MPDILIRDVEAAILGRIKARARRNGRSLQGEAKRILEHSAAYSMPEALASAEQWRKKLGKRKRRFSDSSATIREDRER